MNWLKSNIWLLLRIVVVMLAVSSASDPIAGSVFPKSWLTVPVGLGFLVLLWLWHYFGKDDSFTVSTRDLLLCCPLFPVYNFQLATSLLFGNALVLTGIAGLICDVFARRGSEADLEVTIIGALLSGEMLLIHNLRRKRAGL